MSNKPGRHETSMGGLIGAMIVLVACILAFVAFRELTREVPETKPQAIDWQPMAESALGQGHPIAVPEVPSDWIVTNVRFEPTLKPTWDLAMLTEKQKFAGVFQTDERLDRVVEERIDEKAEEGDALTVTTGAYAGEWQTFTDDGGDFGMAVENEFGVVLVYGSAPRDDLIELAGSLTTAEPADPAATDAP